VEVIDLPRSGRKRRFKAEEKRRLLDEAQAPGSSVSAVARRYGVSPSLLFRAEEAVVPEFDACESPAPTSVP